MPNTEAMTVGSLFSGIGGFDLGLERAGMSVLWQVENNTYCNRVLAKHWPFVTRYGDIKTIDWSQVKKVNLICGSFPCQPFSVAGKRRGKDDDRYLWPEVVRCLDALRPTWFLGENVPGLINLALDQVCTDLESLGYTVWPVCVPACAVDAPHQRQRVWIVAYANSQRQRQPQKQTNASGDRGSSRVGAEECNCGCCELATSPSMAHTSRQRCREAGTDSERSTERTSSGGDALADTESVHAQRLMHRPRQGKSWRSSWWTVEPAVGRVAHGIPRRVDRLRGLGNAVVPQVVEVLGMLILEAEHAQY